MRLPWQPQPEAGRTALAYYEFGLRRWRRQVRPVILVLIATSLGLAALVGHYLPRGSFVAGMYVGGGLVVVGWLWNEPPEWIARWKRGAEGEQQTEETLRPLERAGWRSFHDLDSTYGNLDHVVVGPGGVFLLDTKNLGGTASLEERGLRVRRSSSERDDYLLDSLEGAMRGAAADLKERIEDATQLRQFVRAVVVIWGDFPDGEAEGDRVDYVAGGRLRAWLGKQPTRLSERDQRVIQLALAAGLVAPPAAPVVT